MWEMNEEYMKKRKIYGVLFHYHYAKNRSFGYEVPVSCMEHGSSMPLIWMDDTTNKQVLHAEYSAMKPPSTRWTIYAKKILSLIKRYGIIIMWLGQDWRRFIRWHYQPLTNRGDRSIPDSTMPTWNHSPSGFTRGTPNINHRRNIKQGTIRNTYVWCVIDRASWKTPRWLALDDR